MSRVLQAVAKALRMAGVEADLPKDPPLSKVERALARHGLGLAVVDLEQPSVQLSARWLLRRAVERALAAGEPERGISIRLSRLIGRSQSGVTRALAGEHGIDDEGRAALEAHLLHGKPSDLPPVGKSPGRPPRDPAKIAALDKMFREAPPEWQEVFDELDRRDPKMQEPGKQQKSGARMAQDEPPRGAAERPHATGKSTGRPRGS